MTDQIVENADQLKIILTVNGISDGVPLYKFTLKNYSKTTSDITTVKITIVKHEPRYQKNCVSYTVALKDEPTVSNIILEARKGEFPYNLRNVVKILPDNTADVLLRFYCKKQGDFSNHYPPKGVGKVEVYVSFFDDRGLSAQSELINLSQ